MTDVEGVYAWARHVEQELSELRARYYTDVAAVYVPIERGELIALARAALASSPLDPDTADHLSTLVWRAATKNPNDTEVLELRDQLNPPGTARTCRLLARFHRDVDELPTHAPPKMTETAHRQADHMWLQALDAAREHGELPQAAAHEIYVVLAWIYKQLLRAAT